MSRVSSRVTDATGEPECNQRQPAETATAARLALSYDHSFKAIATQSFGRMRQLSRKLVRLVPAQGQSSSLEGTPHGATIGPVLKSGLASKLLTRLTAGGSSAVGLLVEDQPAPLRFFHVHDTRPLDLSHHPTNHHRLHRAYLRPAALLNTLQVLLTMADQVQEILEVPAEFAREGIQFMRKCTKPDQKEFLRLCQAVGTGFLIMGAIGYLVKLIHLPVNQALVGGA
ncbi:hypothetical protein G7046_g9631 [Stylonectria norvegica]|nr:hypothetical protein G7046_g9631 [Stylonectria norvegica]